MEYIYPAFERGRILKKESLWALRDYSYDVLAVKYKNYSDGIINGCELSVEEKMIVIAPGMLKCQGYIFLLKEPVSVEFKADEKYVALKFRVIDKTDFSDYIRYRTQICLDDRMDKAENEIELCRFKLKEGSILRCQYKDFYDIQTEFDTVNLADAAWAGEGSVTLSKYITDFYALEVLKAPLADAVDINFAGLCLQNREAIRREIIIGYVRHRAGEALVKEDISNSELYHMLKITLDNIRKGTKAWKSGAEYGRRMIVMD